jgi:hypothetical protein
MKVGERRICFLLLAVISGMSRCTLLRGAARRWADEGVCPYTVLAASAIAARSWVTDSAI